MGGGVLTLRPLLQSRSIFCLSSCLCLLQICLELADLGILNWTCWHWPGHCLLRQMRHLLQEQGAHRQYRRCPTWRVGWLVTATAEYLIGERWAYCLERRKVGATGRSSRKLLLRLVVCLYVVGCLCEMVLKCKGWRMSQIEKLLCGKIQVQDNRKGVAIVDEIIHL